MADLVALSNLLVPEDSAIQEEDEFMTPSHGPAHPGHVGPKKKTVAQKPAQEPVKKAETKDIWDVDEVPDTVDRSDYNDTRPTPDYEIMYKQRVGSEDVFLGLAGRDESTACCEDLLVRVKLPETRFTDLTLDVTENFFDCRAPKWKLGFHLPRRVRHKEGNAQWDAKKKKY
eukprot:Colp12_sorted_trinity150504_noHs@26180